MTSSSDKNPSSLLFGDKTVSPVKAMIFDVGSTLVYKTKKETSIQMHNNLSKRAGKEFNWDEATQIKFAETIRIGKSNWDQKKIHIASGTILDEGFMLEYGSEQQLKDAMKNMGIDPLTLHPEFIEEALEEFRLPRVNNVELIEGCHELLQWLRKEGIRCAVCSNDSDAPKVRKILKRFDLEKYFDTIVISVEERYRKPDIRILNKIMKNWEKYGIKEEHCVFVGDKILRDVLVSKYALMRSMHCILFSKEDEKYRVKAGMCQDYFTKHIGSYIPLPIDEAKQTSADVTYTRVDKSYVKPEATIHSLSEIPDVIKKMAMEKYPLKEIKVGVLLMPKKLQKFGNRDVLVPKYRKDFRCIQIDPSKPLEEQGPFDIILHKSTSWYIDAQFDNECKKTYENIYNYIITQNSNLHRDKNHKYKKINKSSHWTFVLDHPDSAHTTCDRCLVYKMLKKAVDDKVWSIGDVKVDVPQSEFLSYQDLQAYQKDFIDKFGEKTLQNKEITEEMKLFAENHKILNKMKNLTFPVIAKPKVAGNGAKNKKHGDGHHMHIVPSLAHLGFLEVAHEKRGEFLLQQYINHKGECHKVYVLGDKVFATINTSTPDINANQKEISFIDSKNCSKQQRDDQSKRDANHVFYHKLSVGLRKVFNLNFFGYDLIFDHNERIGYVIDINFLPSYKSVQNFPQVFWEHVMDKHRKFISQTQEIENQNEAGKSQ